MTGARHGIVHSYTPFLTAFEHTPNTNTTSASAQNLLVFVGGLFDGLQTPPYTSAISDALAPNWSIAQVLLSSSYTGWGTSSLQKDVKELAECITYFRTFKTGKIVLMGHSTGCQDAMEYVTGPGHENRPPIDGAILQGGVSDREAITIEIGPEACKSSCAVAQAMVDAGEGDEILRKEVTKPVFSCPVSAYRWLSLVSPNHDGDDDYFSTDLTDEQLMKSFGEVPARTPLCILLSGNDEYMLKTVDKKALVNRWIGIVNKGKGRVDETHSGLVDGATHNLSRNTAEIVDSLVSRVVGFLNGLSPQSNL